MLIIRWQCQKRKLVLTRSFDELKVMQVLACAAKAVNKCEFHMSDVLDVNRRCLPYPNANSMRNLQYALHEITGNWYGSGCPDEHKPLFDSTDLGEPAINGPGC